MQSYSLSGSPAHQKDPLEESIIKILQLETDLGDLDDRSKLIQIRDQVLKHIRTSHVIGSEELFRKTWKLLNQNDRDIFYPEQNLPKWGNGFWDGLTTGEPRCIVTFLEWLRWRFTPDLFREVGESL